MADMYFAPRISADTAPFWQGCKEHRLLAQRCSYCGTVRWPAAWLCPQCLHDEHAWIELAREGKVYSFVVFHKPFHPSLESKIPYVVAAIDISGVRLLSNIVNCDVEDIRCGACVRVAWSDEEEYSRPVFEMAK